jgi:hypothetical protein
MAQARARPSRSSSSRSRARANGRPADAASSRARATSRAAGRAGGATADKAQDAGAKTTERTTGTLHQIADKAKGPALVGGAAAAAIAGGIAVARNGGKMKGGLPSIGKKRRRISMPHVSLPHLSMPHLPKASDGDAKDALKATAKALGDAAVEVGKVGYRVGELTSEVRRVREQASHRS